jgi:D-tyrosyl-tRNA(Tyr) deacylase
MKVLVQRVLNAKVEVNKEVVGEIKGGLLLFVGFTHTDTSKEIDYMINKVLNLRIFDDENGVMNKSILDVGGEILSISQFTLQAETKKGNRPSYINAMKGEDANKLYEEFNEKLNKQIKTYPGVFGADMLVDIQNNGPTTIILDSME